MLNEKFHTDLFTNATVFLNCAVSYMNKGLDNYNNMMLTIANIQLALELAIKAKIVDYYGIREILSNVDGSISDIELNNLYSQNKLKVKGFDQLKNFLKSKNIIDFDKTHYQYMEKFQLYRNRFVHFNYNFSTQEYQLLKKDIIHVLVYILGILMSDDDDSECRIFMQDYIDMKEYEKLLDDHEYVAMLSDFLDSEYGEPYHCPVCSRKLLTPDKKCLGCLQTFYNDYCYGYLKCQHCKEKMVIYDKLNIELNGNKMKGLCLSCLQYTNIYKCSVCGRTFNLDKCDFKCRPGYCECS